MRLLCKPNRSKELEGQVQDAHLEHGATERHDDATHDTRRAETGVGRPVGPGRA